MLKVAVICVVVVVGSGKSFGGAASWGGGLAAWPRDSSTWLQERRQRRNIFSASRTLSRWGIDRSLIEWSDLFFCQRGDRATRPPDRPTADKEEEEELSMVKALLLARTLLQTLLVSVLLLDAAVFATEAAAPARRRRWQRAGRCAHSSGAGCWQRDLLRRARP